MKKVKILMTFVFNSMALESIDIDYWEMAQSPSTRGTIIRDCELSIHQGKSGRIAVDMRTETFEQVDSVQHAIYVDLWDEGTLKWNQTASYRLDPIGANTRSFAYESITDIPGSLGTHKYRLRGASLAIVDGMREMLAVTSNELVVKAYTGWVNEGTNTYYYDEDMHMCTGLQKIDNGLFFFNSDGEMQRRWVKYKNNLYYFQPTFGAAYVDGWQTIDGIYYRFNEEGILINSPVIDAYTFYYETSAPPYSYIVTDIAHNILEKTGYHSKKVSGVGVMKQQASENSNFNQRINSGIINVFGHALPGVALLAEKLSEDENDEFVCGHCDFEQSNFLALDTIDLSNCSIMAFNGCYSAQTDETYGNLLDSAVTSGAKCALGFVPETYEFGTEIFFEVFYNNLALGKTVGESAKLAKEELPLGDTSRKYVIKGDLNTTLPNILLLDDQDNQTTSTSLAAVESFEKPDGYTLYETYADGSSLYCKYLYELPTTDRYDMREDGTIHKIINEFSDADKEEIRTVIWNAVKNNLGSNDRIYDSSTPSNAIQIESKDISELVHELLTLYPNLELIKNKGKIRLVNLVYGNESIEVTDIVNGNKLSYDIFFE